MDIQHLFVNLKVRLVAQDDAVFTTCSGSSCGGDGVSMPFPVPEQGLLRGHAATEEGRRRQIATMAGIRSAHPCSLESFGVGL